MNLNPRNGPQSNFPLEPRKPPFIVIGAIVAVIAFSGIAIALAMSGGKSDDLARNDGTIANNAGPDEAPTIAPTLTALAATPTPEPPPPDTPTPEPAPIPAQVQSLSSVGSGDRLVISRFGISAPLSLKTVGKDGQMPNPSGEDDVAYYNFSDNWPGFGGAPGKGGNAVFAGHVDSGHAPCKYGTVPPPCTAVLWDLSKVSIGDEIDVSVGGTTYRYSVVSSRSVPESSDWGPIVAATATESITVITCGGDFNAATSSYDHRQVVKANRM